jgi:hypothetical protein
MLPLALQVPYTMKKCAYHDNRPVRGRSLQTPLIHRHEQQHNTTSTKHEEEEEEQQQQQLGKR